MGKVTISVEPITKRIKEILSKHDILYSQMECTYDDGYLRVGVQVNGDEIYKALDVVHREMGIHAGEGHNPGSAYFKFHLASMLDPEQVID